MPTTDAERPAPDGETPGPVDAPDPLLPEYAPMVTAVLTDEERWPTLDDAGHARLRAVREHPHAPLWRHRTGDRLTHADLAALEDRDRDVAALAASVGSIDTTGAPTVPDWVEALAERVHATVPRYRARARAGRGALPLADLPLVTRADLVADVAAHVDLTQDLGRVLEGTSSGTSGAALRVPLHPASIAADLRDLHRLVTRTGATWEVDPARLALALVTDQRSAYTYASMMTAFPRSAHLPPPAMARVNLDPDGWRDPSDRAAWFHDTDPQVVSTSTLPLLRLLELARDGLALHPLAVVNGATHLTPGIRDAVDRAWGAPVVDLYALRETGPIAAALPGDAVRDAHVLLPRRVHVEVLRPDGAAAGPGERGEIVVTTDENPFLPLLRYRTGDTAALRTGPDGPELVGLEGREAVAFLDAAGRARPAVDATQLLQAAGLLLWELHQDAAGAVQLRGLAAGVGAQCRDAVDMAADGIERWLGRAVTRVALTDPAALGPGKPRRFRSDATDPEVEPV